MKRREMLHAGLRKAAQVLPLALAATGGLGRLAQGGAGLTPPQEVASFPTGNPKKPNDLENQTKEEE